MSIYDSEDYIAKVMRIEKCSREDALKLIEEFKSIDGHKDRKETDNAKIRAYRKDWKRRHLCTICAVQDEDTLKGLTRCKKCKARQQEYYRRRRLNATAGQDNQVH